MKRILFLVIFLAILVSGYSQGNKFKAVNRTVPDSAVTGSFTKNAVLIDGSKSQKLHTGSLINSSLSSERLPQLLDSISKDSLPKISVKPADRKPVFIERERSQTPSHKLALPSTMSNEEIAYAFFRETPSLNVSRPEEQIRISSMNTDDLGMTHIKGVQLFHNVPLYGMEFTFHISAQTERFIGYTVDSAQIDRSPAVLNAEEAIGIAESDLSQTTEVKPPTDFMKQTMKYEAPTAEPIYYPNSLNSYRLSYRVIIRPNIRDEWIYYIDAKNGEVVKKFNNTPNAGPAKGSGLDAMGVQRTVDTYEENGVHYMVNTTKPMFNAANFTGKIAIIDAHNNPDIYTTNSTASFASSGSATWNHPLAISGAYNASLVYDYIRNTFNRNSPDDKGMDMFCVVNFPDENGQAYDNAFWNGSGTYFGNGNIHFFPMIRALDCVAHEFGHGVTQFTAALEYQGQSGAINETYSDIMGALLDGNFTVGEDIIKNRNMYPTGFMRDMSNPHNGGSSVYDQGWQPAHVSEMYLGNEDNGGVHINSGIGNYVFYQYATAASMEKAGKIFYRALCNYLTKTSKFIDLRIAVIQAANDLYGDADAKLLGEAFDRVGITEDAGSGNPGDLPTNPGQQILLLTSLDPYDSYGLYKTSDYYNFTPLTYSKMNSRPSVTDNGNFMLFINTYKKIRGLDFTTGNEYDISTDAGYANVAVSRDGSRMAFVTTQQDAKIYVYDFISEQMAAFQLYNPTTGSGGAQSGGVQFAESIEFDLTGEYLIYDAYNIIGGSMGGSQISFWDIGILHVWDKSTESFGSGQISKVFSALSPGESVGNPTFSKNSPHIIAFDYMNPNNEFGTFGMNLSTNTVNLLFTNTTVSFPNYSIDDRTMAFASFGQVPFAGYVALGADKISIAGQGTMIANYATYPVYYGTGMRPLGLKPVAAFSADIRSGKAPLEVQYLDLSANKPVSWGWEFEGGIPSVSFDRNPVVSYSSPGTYKVKLTAFNDYGNGVVEKQAYITVLTAGGGGGGGGDVSVSEVSRKNISVYPNPVKDELTIENGELRIKKITIADLSGKTIQQITGSQKQINVSALSQGVYFVKIETDKGIVTRKLIKE